MVSGASGKYHLYQRTIKEGPTGKPVRAWYYWYLDSDGKPVRRSCGKAKQPVTVKWQAEAAIAALEAREAAEKDRAAAVSERDAAVRLRDVAADMYTAAGKHMLLRTQRGQGLTDTTMAECRAYLDNWILPRWGDSLPGEIKAAAVEDWLLEKKRSNSTKNRCLEVFNEVFSECVRYELIPAAPRLVRLKRCSRKQSVLATEDIRKLFPDSAAELEAVWKETDPREPPHGGLMFGALFLLMLATGARSGEALAVRYAQIDRKRSGLIIDRSLNAKQQIVGHLKKGTADDPRLRVAIIPRRALEALDWWQAVAPEHTDDSLVFTYRGHQIERRHLESRFAAGLRRAGIATDGRRLTPHALRYTYTTRMRRLIPGESLRLMTGHQDAAMTDYYTRTELDGQLAALQGLRPAMDGFWG